MKARTLVLGIGSPFITDDALGFRVADEIRKKNLPDVDVDEASVSGLDLIEVMIDYERVIVVDAILTGAFPAGKVMVLGEESLTATVHGVNPHEVNIGTTIALGKQLEPERFPKEVTFVAVEVNDVWTVADRMTPEVEASLPEAVQTVIDLIEGREV
ncbi:MAG: hydrogenase 2 maturation endopeptidase [Methanomassiliicoccales archaeon PtaU1.Bin124]|nr:MAG: hydrogenase 2 maturation endopeptidase [Methanomassiliicoccales archaeon PtaU1.Bin124]